MAIVLFGNLHRIYAGVISLQLSTSAQQLSNLQEITTPPLIQTKEIQSIRFRKMLLPWLFLNRKTRNNHLFFLISFGGTPEKACWLTNSRRVIQFPNFSVIQGASRSGKMWNISFASFSVPFRNAKLKPEPKKKHEAWRHDMQWICCTTNKLGGIDTSNKKCYYVKHLF